MFKISLHQLNAVRFWEAFNQLETQPMKASVSMHINRIARCLQEEVKSARLTHNKVLTKYCKLDELGEVIHEINEANNVKEAAFLSDEAREEYNKEFISMLECEITMMPEQLSVKDLEEIKLSPEVLKMLSPIIKEFNEETIQTGLSVVEGN